MKHLRDILNRFLAVSIACVIGYGITLIPMNFDSSPYSIFLLVSTYLYILTDTLFIKRIERKPQFVREALLRISALAIPAVAISIFLSPVAAIGIACTYILLGVYEEWVLNTPLEPKSTKPLKEKIFILVFSFGILYALFIFTFGIMHIVGFFDGWMASKLPPLVAGVTVTRINWIFQYSCLVIAYYFVHIQRNETNKIQMDFIAGVYFLHLLLSSIWAFALTALSSWALAIATVLSMAAFLFWCVSLIKGVSRRAAYFTLPALIGRSFGVYSLLTGIIMNIERWNFL